ncbi:MAG TPA: hypothetical protein VGC89_10590 [Pyrinomonadaceae bacterium]
MSSKVIVNRASEHLLRAPFDVFEGEQKDDSAQKYYYTRLAHVAVKHTYYNLSEDECPDFTFSPTSSSSALMTSLGLIFRSEATGFSILYNEQRKDDLFNYLKRQKGRPGPNVLSQDGVWTRLSFVLTLNNPYFINFTDIPIKLNPSTQNFYFSNDRAHKVNKRAIILNCNDYVSDNESELLTVAPVQYPVNISKAVKEVRVRDISGELVMCQSRCVPISETPQDMARLVNCKHKIHSPPVVLRCRDRIYLDFASLPEDRYTIQKIMDDHLLGHKEPWVERDIIYTASAPTPLCFIDLLFTNPAGGDTGFYPVKDLFGTPKIVNINYQLRFRTRSTFWTYFIVPQPQQEKFQNLRIESVEQKKAQQVNFAGPCYVTLANGQKGYRFVSEKQIPFRQQPEYSFRLLGQHGLMPNDGVIIERLPVATKQQILRDELIVLYDLERNLCVQGNDKRCRRLIRRLSKCFREGAGSTAELARLKRQGANPRSQQFEQQRQRCPNLYSDTYVYV